MVNSFINHIKELNCKDTRVNYKDCNGKFLGEWLLFEEIVYCKSGNNRKKLRLLLMMW